MSTKYGILCFILLLMIVFLTMRSYETWTHPVELNEERGVMKKSETKVEGPLRVAAPEEPVPMKSYASIAEKNVFSPERKDFPETTSGSRTSAKPIVRPSIMLYGITLSGNDQWASIVQSGRSLRKGEREMMTLKVGEKIGEYKLAKILPDRITLESNGDTFEVSLYDPRTPKQRIGAKTESKPAAVTSTLPTRPTPPPQVPRPLAQGGIERPKEPAPERMTPSPIPTPGRPSFSPPSTRRRLGPISPPTGSPTPPVRSIRPRVPVQEEEEEEDEE